MAGTSLELLASDPYAKHLAEWRDVELPRWQKELEQWEASDQALPAPKPRPPPTVKSKGLQPTPQREAAYEAAKAEHTPWNNRYREAKAGRRAKQMAAVDAVREREKRDWKAERAERPIRAERRARKGAAAAAAGRGGC